MATVFAHLEVYGNHEVSMITGFLLACKKNCSLNPVFSLSLFFSLAGTLKSLLQLQPPCPELCCHIVKQHPMHSQIFAKYLKKHGTVLPAQASLLALLLSQDEITVLTKAALFKILDDIKEWVLDIDGAEDETSMLLPHVLKQDLLGEFIGIT